MLFPPGTFLRTPSSAGKAAHITKEDLMESSLPTAQGRSAGPRLVAVLDVLAVFLATFLLIWAARLLPIDSTVRNFVNYTIMIGFPLLILGIRRRDPERCGLYFGQMRVQLNLAGSVLILALIEGAIAGWLLPMMIPNAIIRWEGAIILSIVGIGFFFWAAWILRSKPTLAAAPALLLLLPLAQARASLLLPLVSFVFYLCFLGPGEEWLFRGYIQSRLNEAFGRTFCFWGVRFGWGLFISALMFGCMHVLNGFNPFTGARDFMPWWGVWTVFGGLWKGYLREKAGSIIPGAILHGLPQAIASLMFGFFAVR
jgi:uncharacterized protein